MIRRRFLKLGAGAAVALAGTPAVARAQGKGKVRLAYLQLGWAGTEIIHKEDLLGKQGWSAEYSIVPGAPGPLLNQLAARLLLCASANNTPTGTTVAYGPKPATRAWNP